MAIEPQPANKPYSDGAPPAVPVAEEGGSMANSEITIEFVRSLIFALNKEASLWQATEEVALNQILQTTADSLGNQIASIWQMNDIGTELFCIARHETGIGEIEPSGSFREETNPVFFQSLKDSRIIAVENAMADGRTEELVESYLRPNSIHALMGSTLQREGKVHGIVVFEQAYSSRVWTSPEKELAVAMADLINHVMLVSELRQQNQLLGLLNSIANESGLTDSPEELARLSMSKLQQLFPDIWAGFYQICKATEDMKETAKLVCFVGEEIPDFARSTIEEIPLKDGLLRTVTDLGEVFVIPDCDAWADSLDQPLVDIAVAVGIKSIISIPLNSGGNILAFIQVWSRKKIYNQESDYYGFKAIASTFAVDYGNAINLEQLQLRAFHDKLTGLFNHDQLAFDIDSINLGEPNLLIVVELKGFKQINDTLGRSNGDSILILVGERLQSLTEGHKYATAYRLNGPEYCLLIQDFSGESSAVTQSIHDCLAEPLEVDGLHLVMHPVMGVAQTPDHSRDGRGLLRSADIALGWAKKSREEVCLYETGKDNLGPDNLALLADLRVAIEQDELMLYFQPQFNLQSGRMISCEALLRWQHKDFGYIEPERFIRVAESGDLIRSLTFWVARHTVSQISIFKLMDISVPTSINISDMDIVDSDFPSQIKSLLEEFAVEPENLRVEVTEATLMSDPDRSIKIISELGELGVKVDIDDFGTGYSCIAGIRTLPLATIKIDECFIGDVVSNKRHQTIVSSIIGMAHGLGVEVVAEGVEDLETVEFLKTLGCDMGQGFHFARPVPAADFLTRAPGWL